MTQVYVHPIGIYIPCPVCGLVLGEDGAYEPECVMCNVGLTPIEHEITSDDSYLLAWQELSGTWSTAPVNGGRDYVKVVPLSEVPPEYLK